MVDETQSNQPVNAGTDTPAPSADTFMVADMEAGSPVEITGSPVEAAESPVVSTESNVSESPRPAAVPGELSPSSLNNISDEDLFGAHMAEGGSSFGGTFRTLTEGEVVKGEVVRIDREGVLVDVGQKSEGLIKPQELGRENPEEAPLAVGDTVDVMVIPGETPEGQILLSKKRADFEKAWDKVIIAQQNDEIIHAMVTDRVKGGLVVDLGIRGFIPASHVGNGKVRNLEKYIGESLPLKVIEVDKERRKVVLSHRMATEGERERQREETLESLKEGQVRAGVVRRITDYGAFVDLGGVDGLLHISEMSWSRIKHPSEVVKQGQEIQVMVLKVSPEQNRISLGMRQILPDPWTEASRKYHPGDLVEGKITRLVQSGAFMQLEGGIEGFIKNSELAQRRVQRPEDVVKVGDTVNVKVLDVRPDERRIELSRKATEKREERDRDDRQMREYRQRQPEERFTIGDALGGALDALAARRAQADAGPSPAAGAVPESSVTTEMTEGAPDLASASIASEAEAANQANIAPPIQAGDADLGGVNSPVAEANAPAVEPLTQTEEQSRGEQPDIPA